MDTEEYRRLWKEEIRICEMESSKEKAESFVLSFYNIGNSGFCSIDDKNLLLIFVGLVVYEKKFQMKFGSTTPAAFCYQELLSRANDKRIDKMFIYDVGDWAADYSDNEYVPMCTYRGYGPRQYFAFWHDYELRVAAEQRAKEKKLERLRAEGRSKVEAAKRKHQERLDTIQELKEKSVDDCLAIIEQSEKPVFYYYELIKEWFKSDSLSNDQREKILSMFPSKSTRQNNRMRKYLETLDRDLIPDKNKR